ncbi:MAG: O-methyltransferase [Candidatus Thorarchaeota archaeon]
MTTTDAELILKEIEASKNHYIIGRIRGQVLVRIAREFHPQRILEIGTNVGYSTILLGKELPPRAQITSIEINPEFAQQARTNIKRAKIEPKVEVLIGDALEIIPTLKNEYDFVFIDAAKSQYFAYLQALEPHLFRGSMIVADNVGKHEDQMQDYLKHVRESGGYTSRFIMVGNDGVELSIKR